MVVALAGSRLKQKCAAILLLALLADTAALSLTDKLPHDEVGHQDRTLLQDEEADDDDHVQTLGDLHLATRSNDDDDDGLSDDDLSHFLSQFVLIKTPYGYILGRTQPASGMARARRFHGSTQSHANSNFQLRVRKSGGASPYFGTQHNFQLRVRKNAGADGQDQKDEAEMNLYDVLQMRARKAIWQEIRDRRRSAADHSNSNFQLRVRKSDPFRELRYMQRPGQNFQLRVRRSVA